ncbi:MAG: GNAT family N-acetyltransferase [Thioalkalivibrio sp.]
MVKTPRQPVILRPLEESDYDALPRLTSDPEEAARAYWECIEPGDGICAVRDVLRARQDLTVAVIRAQGQDRVVGLGALYDVEEGKQGYVGPLVVDPMYREHGVGGSLMSHLLGIAFKRHRVREMRARVLGENEDGIMLCSELGFVPYSNEERIDPDGRRHVVVQMRINRREHEDND